MKKAQASTAKSVSSLVENNNLNDAEILLPKEGIYHFNAKKL